ncbi:MAG: thiamine pyrophosphate-dependent enzyme, partial [Anaerolineales bacterium]
MSEVTFVDSHPLDTVIRSDRMPHIWCPGCGIGIAMRCYAHAILNSGIDEDQQVVVSGIGCSGRVAGYMNIDSYHTTHGRAIPFATGLKLSNPELNVTVFSGDGDLAAIGGNHLI